MILNYKLINRWKGQLKDMFLLLTIIYLSIYF